MPIDILMPALSPTMEKGTLARWLKHEGDKIQPGDVIAEIETDKATMEVEAVDEGVLAKIVVPEGTADVPVNQVIGVIAQEGEDVSAAAARPARRPSRKSPRPSSPIFPLRRPVTRRPTGAVEARRIFFAAGAAPGQGEWPEPRIRSPAAGRMAGSSNATCARL